MNDSDDRIDARDRLRALADEARQQAATLPAPNAGVAWGEDPGGVIRAAMNQDGGVVAVQINLRWRSRLDGRDFGTAVVEAVAAAGQALVEGRIVPAPRATPEADQPSPEPPMVLDGSPEASMRRLWELLNDVEASMDQVRDVAAQAASGEATGRSATGTVAAMARGGALVRVECDRIWLRDATREQVQADLQQALAAALPGQLLRVRAAVRNAGRMGELFDLAADPMRLMAALGVVAPTRSGASHAAA